jgi:glycosyltransferase involved in cell wall biosynthesis
MHPKRIAVLHNYYQHSGGEDVVFHSEVELLRSYGHEVFTYTVSNDTLKGLSALQMARRAIWNPESYHALKKWFAETRPDVAHFHNILYLLSPSAYKAAYDSGVAVVQTLHNYRLICPGGQLLRNQKPCELCVGKLYPYPSVFYGCYHGDRKMTFLRTLFVLQQKRAKLWEQAIQVFIALTEFSREKFLQGGLPQEKLVVKPNFVAPDPGMGEHRGEYFLYVGRLSPEKGIGVLLEAWQRFSTPPPLKIVGDGPLASTVQHAAQTSRAIEWLGKRPRDEVLTLMQDAKALIFPSICYENMSVSLIEALATGLPVIASGHGSMASIVKHGYTGWLFTPHQPDALAASVEEALRSPERLCEMQQNAREEYLRYYTPEKNYELLTNIYRRAIEMRQGGAVCES